MKKKIFPLAIVATLLVGCSSSSATTYTSEIKDGDKTIATADDVKMMFTIIY